MADQLFPVPFHDDTLVLVAHDDEPYVAMKAIVENMGLSWATQTVKLNEKFGSTVSIIETVGEDGKQREMLCLPLRKLAAWLYSINANKVAPELREKIVRYQDECDEILWQYWTKGFVARPGVSQPTAIQQLAVHRHINALTKALKVETNPVVRQMLHAQLVQSCRMSAIACPALADIGRNEAPQHEDPRLAEFWEVVDLLIDGDDKQQLNHARSAGLIAINLPQVQAAAHAAKLVLPEASDLRLILKHSRSPKFAGIKAVNSRYDSRSVKCWVFERSDEAGEEI